MRSVLLFLLLCASSAWGGDESCLKCHADAGALAKARTDSKTPLERWLVDRARYAGSVHSTRGCAECHFDYDTHPHGEDAETAACSALVTTAGSSLPVAAGCSAPFTSLRNSVIVRSCSRIRRSLSSLERSTRE